MKPEDKEASFIVASDRAAFWGAKAATATHPDVRAYFLSRENHWKHTMNAIQLEP